MKNVGLHVIVYVVQYGSFMYIARFHTIIIKDIPECFKMRDGTTKGHTYGNNTSTQIECHNSNCLPPLRMSNMVWLSDMSYEILLPAQNEYRHSVVIPIITHRGQAGSDVIGRRKIGPSLIQVMACRRTKDDYSSIGPQRTNFYEIRIKNDNKIPVVSADISSKYSDCS